MYGTMHRFGKDDNTLVQIYNNNFETSLSGMKAKTVINDAMEAFIITLLSQ